MPDRGMPDSSPPPLDFGGAVLMVVDGIPPGRVMTYGDVAAELGSRGARAVGRVMATEGSSVPWWRVVRADGRPPAGHEVEALAHYRAERTPLRRGDERGVDDGGAAGLDDRHGPHAYRLDLGAARWSPS
ncbi:MGMT family protein [Microcella sp.]|uniref:MGMT family protein n=1 Tax=Microcella sp. TaxID=1913979 RepID=UPI003F70A0F7